MKPEITLIAVGNRFRCDDAVGYDLARRVQAEVIPEATLLETSGEGATLIELLSDRDTVFLFDAVSSGAEPGTIFRFSAHAAALPMKFFNYSTHAFSVAEAIEMARALEMLPSVLLVYGIEGADFSGGVGLSQPVTAALEEVVVRVKADLAAMGSIAGTSAGGKNSVAST